MEVPVGFKYIAEKMINQKIFIGGEESGGIGFGNFMPERDALFSAMILLNGIAEQSQYLFETLDQIQTDFGPSFYRRIDINFPNESKKNYLQEFILNNMPEMINDHKIFSISKIDGIKLRMNKNFWLLFRFSGTEPLLRLYCEAPSQSYLNEVLEWSNKLKGNQTSNYSGWLVGDSESLADCAIWPFVRQYWIYSPKDLQANLQMKPLISWLNYFLNHNSFEILMNKETIEKARKSVERMAEVGR